MEALYEQSLTAVYRILFLCFAEARGLVPAWHPVYRDAYTMESVRTAAERPDAARGLWEALQAISRLAHQGCEAGDLRVTAFNGRLFAPARAPLLEHAALPDNRVREVVLALSTTEGTGGLRERVWYRDLGVEELGAVYEGLLDYEPGSRQSASSARGAAPGAGVVPHQKQGIASEGDRHFLYAAADHALPRPRGARAAGPRCRSRPHPGAQDRGPRDGQRRLSRRRVPLPRARVRGGGHRCRTLPRSETSRRRIAPAFAGWWRSGVSSGST